MTNLVFLEPNKIDATPFTTSDVIAMFAGTSYRSVQRTIERQYARLERFGRVRFEITPLETEGGLQNKKIYRLNEEQATLLITFLKNTDRVADFKAELVRQFYLMRKELLSRQITRTALIPARRELTDVIKETNPDTWTYKHYMDLCYKAVVGMNAKQIREAHGAPKKANATDLLTSAEQAAVLEVTRDAAVLRKLGVPYDQTKAIMGAYDATRLLQSQRACLVP